VGLGLTRTTPVLFARAFNGVIVVVVGVGTAVLERRWLLVGVVVRVDLDEDGSSTSGCGGGRGRRFDEEEEPAIKEWRCCCCGGGEAKGEPNEYAWYACC
jgi:hypothetical protein